MDAMTTFHCPRGRGQACRKLKIGFPEAIVYFAKAADPSRDTQIPRGIESRSMQTTQIGLHSGWMMRMAIELIRDTNQLFLT